MTLGDAIFAIEESIFLEHPNEKLCDGCKEMKILVKKLSEYLDMTINSGNVLWDLLHGHRVVQMHKVSRPQKKKTKNE